MYGQELRKCAFGHTKTFVVLDKTLIFDIAFAAMKAAAETEGTVPAKHIHIDIGPFLNERGPVERLRRIVLRDYMSLVAVFESIVKTVGRADQRVQLLQAERVDTAVDADDVFIRADKIMYARKDALKEHRA